jgi:hypothetical protein
MLTAPDFAADPAVVVVTTSPRPVELVRADHWNAHPLGADTSPAGTNVASLPLLGDGGGGVHNARHHSWSPSYDGP